MRVALISDLHGNLTALETVLDDLDRERPDRVLCLGDVAATGPQPRETVERLREVGCPVVMGNADAALLGPIPVTGDEETRRILEIDRWCAEQLSTEHLDFISGFQPTLNAHLDPGMISSASTARRARSTTPSSPRPPKKNSTRCSPATNLR